MIERKNGEDADLIIEDRWPYRYDEDKLLASAEHHRKIVAVALDSAARPALQSCHDEAVTHNAGHVAQAAVKKTLTHLRATDVSTARHLRIADELDTFAAAVISGKTRINQAADTFTSQWAQATVLAKANNWYQHEYNSYRTQLIETGRATVDAALHDISTADDSCMHTLRSALDT